jgi:hypothetical protein
MSAPRTAAALAGFIILGLSPSFLDWQQDPERRWQIVVYYGAALLLLYLGLLRR